jgi:hypothetical protein
MARKLYIVPILLFLCVFSSIFTTEFKDARQLVRETTARFQDDVNIDLTSNGSDVTVTARMPLSRHVLEGEHFLSANTGSQHDNKYEYNSSTAVI